MAPPKSTVFDDTTILQWIDDRGIDAVIKFGGKGGCWKTETGEPETGNKSKTKFKDASGKEMDNPVIYTNNWLVDPSGKFHKLRWRTRDLVLHYGVMPRDKRNNNFASQMERNYLSDHPSDRLNFLLCEKWEKDIVAAKADVPLVAKKGKAPCDTNQTHYSMDSPKTPGEPLEHPKTRYKLFFKGARTTKFLDQSRCTRGANGSIVFEPFFGGKVNEDNIHEVLKRGATSAGTIFSADTTSFSAMGVSFMRSVVLTTLDHSTVETNDCSVDDLGLDMSQFAISEPAAGEAAEEKVETGSVEEVAAGVDQMLDDMNGMLGE